jgi:hypothetical protein
MHSRRFLIQGFTVLPLFAQTADNNPVERNNDPYVTLSQAKHTSGNNYMWPPYNPPQFSPAATTPGVPANTLSWRWIPSETNVRREARMVSGFDLGIRPSAATTSQPSTGYFPEIKVHVGKAVGSGTSWVAGRRYEPDLAQNALITEAQTTLTFPQVASYLVSRTISTPVSVNQLEIVLSARWRGGENDNVAGSQGLWGSYSDGTHAPLTCGFADPSNAITLAGSDFAVLHFTYHEEQASISVQSDWGYRRDPILVPTVSGYSIGTAQADLATRNGQIGWDVFAGKSQANFRAVPLLNIGPIFPVSFNLFGQTIEMNIGDPNLALLLSAGYLLTLDNDGFGNGALLPLPALGGPAIGTSIGVEFLILDPTQNRFTESTQSTWVTITR